jgi:hypothetical protein
MQSDFFTPGDGLLVTDDATELVWLSPVATTGISRNTILAGHDGLVTTEGFRYATENEVVSMIQSNFGTITTEYTASGFDAAEAFFDVFGIAQNSNCFLDGEFVPCPRTQGITSDLSVGFSDRHDAVGVIQFGPNGRLIVDNPFPDSDTSSQFGSWLVREVPEPSSCVMITFGCGLLAFRRQNRLTNRCS